MLKAGLAEVELHLATVAGATSAYKDALSAVRHLERVILGGDGSRPSVNRHGLRLRS
jgi:hypothetical protein